MTDIVIGELQAHRSRVMKQPPIKPRLADTMTSLASCILLDILAALANNATRPSTMRKRKRAQLQLQSGRGADAIWRYVSAGSRESSLVLARPAPSPVVVSTRTSAPDDTRSAFAGDPPAAALRPSVEGESKYRGARATYSIPDESLSRLYRSLSAARTRLSASRTYVRGVRACVRAHACTPGLHPSLPPLPPSMPPSYPFSCRAYARVDTRSLVERHDARKGWTSTAAWKWKRGGRGRRKRR
jgi:hypothetical protein